MHRLKTMKEILVCAAQEQMCHLDCVDAKELGEVVDMIKDLEEAIYYCTITEAMHASDEPHEHGRMYYPMYNVMDKHNGNNDVYYRDARDSEHDWGEASNGNGEYMRDHREGKSSTQRRKYMESKEKHHTKAQQLQELEKYVKDLSEDLVDMIEEATAEEKQYLGNRIAALATKITKMAND